MLDLEKKIVARLPPKKKNSFLDKVQLLCRDFENTQPVLDPHRKNIYFCFWIQYTMVHGTSNKSQFVLDPHRETNNSISGSATTFKISISYRPQANSL